MELNFARGASACAALVLAVVSYGCGSADTDGLIDGSGATNGGGNGGSGAGGTGASGGATTGGVGGLGGGAGSTSGGSGGGGACDYSGTWATHLNIQVEWAATTVLTAGSDRIRMWMLSERDHLADKAEDVVSICGITLPDFQSNFLGGNEKFGVWFDGESFDGSTLPKAILKTELEGPFDGASFLSEPIPILIGMHMDEPVHGTFPSLWQVDQRDHDQDNRPGFTTFASKGGGYFHPPVDAFKSSRAQALWIASRTVATLYGRSRGCDRLEGSVEVQAVDGRPGIQSHIIGCILENGQACSSMQTSFVDENRPEFVPNGMSSMESVRVSAGTSCAQVRGMFQ